MKKHDFIMNVAETLECTKTEASNAIDTVIREIAKVLEEKDSINFIGFGTFKTVHKAKRKARNPQTGESIKIKAHDTVKFTPAKALKEQVW